MRELTEIFLPLLDVLEKLPCGGPEIDGRPGFLPRPFDELFGAVVRAAAGPGGSPPDPRRPPPRRTPCPSRPSGPPGRWRGPLPSRSNVAARSAARRGRLARGLGEEIAGDGHDAEGKESHGASSLFGESLLRATARTPHPIPLPDEVGARASTCCSRRAYPARRGEGARRADEGAQAVASGPLTPSLSPTKSGRGRARAAPAAPIPLGGGVHRPLLPTGEKVPEGRMRGRIRHGARDRMVSCQGFIPRPHRLHNRMTPARQKTSDPDNRLKS